MKKMKKMKKYISLITILFVILLFLSANHLMAQGGPPPPPPEDDTGQIPIGGSAPISGGTLILIGLAAAYGGKKVYRIFKEEEK